MWIENLNINADLHKVDISLTVYVPQSLNNGGDITKNINDAIKHAGKHLSNCEMVITAD